MRCVRGIRAAGCRLSMLGRGKRYQRNQSHQRNRIFEGWGGANVTAVTVTEVTLMEAVSEESESLEESGKVDGRRQEGKGGFEGKI